MSARIHTSISPRSYELRGGTWPLLSADSDGVSANNPASEYMSEASCAEARVTPLDPDVRDGLYSTL